MRPTDNIQSTVNRRMKDTLNKIDLRKEKHNKVAIELGFKNSQEAFNKLGKEFLTIANK